MPNLIDNDALDIGTLLSGYGEPGIVQNDSIGLTFSAQVNSTGNLEVYKSSDEGVSWTLDTTFTDDTNMRMFSLATSVRGDIFVAFSYITDVVNDTYTIKVKKRDYITGVWSEVLNEIGRTSTTYPVKPLVTWNRFESNRLHLAWMEHSTGGNGSIFNIYSDDYGATWNSKFTNQKVIFLGDADYALDSIETNPIDGTLWTYSRLVETASTLLVYSFSSAGVWGGFSDNLPSATTRLHRGASSVTDSTGKRWTLLYYKYSSTDQYRLEVIDSSGTYDLTVLSVDSGSGLLLDGNVSIGCNSADDIYIFYTKLSDSKCYYRKFDAVGTAWGVETELTTGDGFRPACTKHKSSGSDRFITTFYTD